ncbi:MAG: hypothetical protein U1E42_06865 [Rhodospirillales bacterium]
MRSRAAFLFAVSAAVALAGWASSAAAQSAPQINVPGFQNTVGETLTNLGDVTANVAEGVNVGSVGGAMNPGDVNGVNLGGTNGINMITANTGVANVANSIAINAKVQ